VLGAGVAECGVRALRSTLLALMRQELRLGEPRVIVDRDVEVLPAAAAGAVGGVAVDAVPHATDPAELLHIEVEELPGARVLVAHDGLRRLEPDPTSTAPHCGQSCILVTVH
jgi:hypothetical protein